MGLEGNAGKAVNLTGTMLNYDNELQAEAERLFSSPCEFVLSVPDYHMLPKPGLPEVAFIGRSNVGKSSLLNALIKQKKLARVSVTPGRTQQINFFCLAKSLLLVDLPGYGFAKAPIHIVKQWEKMTLAYLQNRESLKRVFLLIDARHGFKKNDLEFMTILDKMAVAYQVVLTKLDKTNKVQVNSMIAFAQENIQNHSAMFPDIVLTSSKKSSGLEYLRTYIYHLLPR